MTSSQAELVSFRNFCRNCDDPDLSTHRNFEQPVWQTLNMFAGESLCLLAFYLLNFLLGSNTRGIGDDNKPHHYQPIPRQSQESNPYSEDEHQVAPSNDSQPPIIPNALIQPTHLKHGDPQDSAPLLAVHGPTPTPLVASIDPELLASSSSPDDHATQLIGIQKMIFWLPTIFDICGTTVSHPLPLKHTRLELTPINPLHPVS